MKKTLFLIAAILVITNLAFSQIAFTPTSHKVVWGKWYTAAADTTVNVGQWYGPFDFSKSIHSNADSTWLTLKIDYVQNATGTPSLAFIKFYMNGLNVVPESYAYGTTTWASLFPTAQTDTFWVAGAAYTTEGTLGTYSITIKPTPGSNAPTNVGPYMYCWIGPTTSSGVANLTDLIFIKATAY